MIRNLYHALYRALHGFDPIPDAEIESAVRQLFIHHPGGPVAEAAARVERLQWSKNGREQVKAEKVLKALDARFM